VDLEDWYTSAYLRDYLGHQAPIKRIEETTQKILTIFDKHKVSATFFVLGHLVEEYPELIKRIHSKGHEIASHGYSHTPLWDLDLSSFENELIKTNQLISNITNKNVLGFRAPYASLDEKTSWAIDILEKNNFLYDSSIFPMKTPLYGVEEPPLSQYIISSNRLFENNPDGKIIEIPFTIYENSLIKIPCTGGIYGRFMPYFIFKGLLSQIEKKRAINFYFHPWEIDKDLPKIKVPFYNKVVSYYNTNNYLWKIDKILNHYEFTSFEKKLNLT
jgi:polysaccharide deacetylase family protein (PEP-CTERM system associated)